MSSGRYVALLRGINVGAAKRVPMAELRLAIGDVGGDEVKTLLNSGNAVFTYAGSKANVLAGQIHDAVAKRTGVDARVTVLEESEVQAIARENPFADVGADPSRMLISVFSDPQLRAEVEPLLDQDWGAESFAVGRLATYAVCPQGVLGSQCLKALEKALGERVTSRNLRTFDKLVALL